jgi:ABC-type transport system involved in cytochrome c biogenesis permease subunit
MTTMSRALKVDDVAAVPASGQSGSRASNLLPAILGVACGLGLIAARHVIGPQGFLVDGSTVVLALILYISSGVLHMTHVYVRLPWIRSAALWLAAAGLTSNIASWGFRWYQAGDAEQWSEWLWRYIPLANLYDITLAFVFVAVAFMLVIERKPKHTAVGAITMPVASLLLMLAVFLGNEQRTLQPILDSYWRPIHVGIAAVSYGVCLVSFGLAILYLIRDGLRMSAAAAWVTGFGVFTYLFIDRGAVLLGTYSSSVLVGNDAIPLLGGGSLRVAVPGTGLALLVGFLSVLAAFAVLAYAEYANRDDTRRLGMKLVVASIVVQTVAIGFVAYRVSTLDDLAAKAKQVRPETLVLVGGSLAKNSGVDPATIDRERLQGAAVQVIDGNADRMRTSVRSNPIEFSALISVVVMMLVVAVLAIRPERVIESLPSLKTLDGLQYLAVSIAFPLLSLLLITGAVWANESWGRYWGWDNKEVGALVTWLAYAGYLHTRIAHGWTGRRSAYVALLGFVFVIFTYLGVSYLLPGLHSYAS